MDLLDILTIDEARDAINVTAGHTSEIEVMVTAVSRRIDDLCGPVVVRTVTDELHDGGTSGLFLHHYPVASITSVTEYSGGTPTTVTPETTTVAGGYRLANGVLSRRSSWGMSRWGSQVTVTYEAGRYADTAAVDAKFKMAAGAVLRRLWTREAGAWARGADPFIEAGAGHGFFKVVDPMVHEFLAAELLPPAIA